MEVFCEEDNVDRLFSEWKMGYVQMSDDDISGRLDDLGILPADKISQRLSQDTNLATAFIAGFISLLRGQASSVENYLSDGERSVDELFSDFDRAAWVQW